MIFLRCCSPERHQEVYKLRAYLDERLMPIILTVATRHTRHVALTALRAVSVAWRPSLNISTKMAKRKIIKDEATNERNNEH